MRIIRYLWSVFFIFFLVVVLIKISFNLKQNEKNKYLNEDYLNTASKIELNLKECYDNLLSTKIMSFESMATRMGGCSSGGGTCDYFYHNCGGCTYLHARQCSGGPGNCVNDGYTPVCRCGSSYIFIEGCI